MRQRRVADTLPRKSKISAPVDFASKAEDWTSQIEQMREQGRLASQVAGLGTNKAKDEVKADATNKGDPVAEIKKAQEDAQKEFQNRIDNWANQIEEMRDQGRLASQVAPIGKAQASTDSTPTAAAAASDDFEDRISSYSNQIEEMRQERIAKLHPEGPGNNFESRIAYYASCIEEIRRQRLLEKPPVPEPPKSTFETRIAEYAAKIQEMRLQRMAALVKDNFESRIAYYARRIEEMRQQRISVSQVVQVPVQAQVPPVVSETEENTQDETTPVIISSPVPKVVEEDDPAADILRQIEEVRRKLSSRNRV